MKCTAKAKRTGESCQAQAIRGKDKCRVHGGMTPVKHGLFSKYPDAIAARHLDAARDADRLDILKSTVALLAAILSRWTEEGTAFHLENSSAVSTLAGRLTNAISEYEKLTNPELRGHKLEIDFKNMSDEELIIEAESLLLEAKGE